MTTVMGGIILTGMPPENIPDDVMIAPDRKGGWKVRHPLRMEWIEGIQCRMLAGTIQQALIDVAKASVDMMGGFESSLPPDHAEICPDCQGKKSRYEVKMDGGVRVFFQCWPCYDKRNGVSSVG